MGAEIKGDLLGEGEELARTPEPDCDPEVPVLARHQDYWRNASPPAHPFCLSCSSWGLLTHSATTSTSVILPEPLPSLPAWAPGSSPVGLPRPPPSLSQH